MCFTQFRKLQLQPTKIIQYEDREWIWESWFKTRCLVNWGVDYPPKLHSKCMAAQKSKTLWAGESARGPRLGSHWGFATPAFSSSFLCFLTRTWCFTACHVVLSWRNVCPALAVEAWDGQGKAVVLVGLLGESFSDSKLTLPTPDFRSLQTSLWAPAPEFPLFLFVLARLVGISQTALSFLQKTNVLRVSLLK